MRKLAIALAVLAAIGVAGCGTVSITPARLDSIKSVSVASAVKVADKAVYHGPEGAWATALGGGVGAALTQIAASEPEQIKTYLTREGIEVGEIVRTRFLQALQGDPRFASKLGGSGDARFELEVFLYGLISNGPFSRQYRTWLGIQAKLVESDKVIWQDKDHVFLNDAVPLAPYAAYFENPATFRVGFTAAADVITQLLLKKMGD